MNMMVRRADLFSRMASRPSDLTALIEEHRRAKTALVEFVEANERAGEEFHRMNERDPVLFRLDSRSWCEAHLPDAHDTILRRYAEEQVTVKRLFAFMGEAELAALAHKVEEEEEAAFARYQTAYRRVSARARTCGFDLSGDRYAEMRAAEQAAASAIIDHACRNARERRMKRAYLAARESGNKKGLAVFRLTPLENWLLGPNTHLHPL